MTSLVQATQKKMRARCLVIMRAFWPPEVRAILGANKGSLGKKTRVVKGREIAFLQCKHSC